MEQKIIKVSGLDGTLILLIEDLRIWRVERSGKSICSGTWALYKNGLYLKIYDSDDNYVGRVFKNGEIDCVDHPLYEISGESVCGVWSMCPFCGETSYYTYDKDGEKQLLNRETEIEDWEMSLGNRIWELVYAEKR